MSFFNKKDKSYDSNIFNEFKKANKMLRRDTPVDLQMRIHRMFNTEDGKIVLSHWISEFLLATPYVHGINNTDLGYALGKSDFVKLIYLTAIKEG